MRLALCGRVRVTYIIGYSFENRMRLTQEKVKVRLFPPRVCQPFEFDENRSLTGIYAWQFYFGIL